ncbi:MAG: LuxR C-terminal-related transcriptional regulator, partial [Acidimicrobiia bacterium]
ADLSAPRLRRLPEGLAERVANSVRRLDKPERATLEVLAVAGRALALREVEALTGRPLEELEPVLAGLVATRMVVEEERGRELTYEVHHPLIRDLIYEAIGGARRRLLHRRAARALLASGRVSEAALHFARSGEPGDGEAVGALLEAIRQAGQREAYYEALDLLAELVELLPAGDHQWLQVLEALFEDAEWIVDHRVDTHASVVVKALQAIDGLLEGSRDTARQAKVKVHLGSFLAWGTGQLQAAEGVCREARRLFETVGDERRALLAGRELAWLRGLQGSFSDMAAEAQHVVHAADAAGDRFVAMQALATGAYSATFQGRFDQAEGAINRAITIAREDEKSYRLTALLGLQALSLGLQGDTGGGLSLIEEAKSLDPTYRDSVVPMNETFVRWIAGDYRGAVATAREEAAWLSTAPSRRRALGMSCGALSAIENDDTIGAKQFLVFARSALEGREWFFHTQYGRYPEGMLAWHEDRVSDAISVLQEVASQLMESEARAWSAIVLADLAEIAGEVGETDMAASAAASLEDIAAVVDRPFHLGLAAAASAWVKLGAGDGPAAADLAQRAVDLLSTVGCHGHLGRAHHLLGRALAVQQDSQAVSALQRAAELFETGGATWRRQRTLETLRRLGSAGRRALASALGPGGLTPRERDVARLAARGMSAKEIAESLFVGERTVESHLRSLYAKLGVSSKIDLVRRASELGFS